MKHLLALVRFGVVIMVLTKIPVLCDMAPHRLIYSNSTTGLDRPRGFQEVEVPRFQDIQHMKVVRLSALHTGRLYPPRKYSWHSFLLEDESTPWP